MSISFQSNLQKIRHSEKPINTAWMLAYDFLLLEEKTLKLIQILADHENLFINYNPYHDHFHTAEVILASAYLIKNEGLFHKNYDSTIILLLAATFHDADHKGKSNKYPYEQEKISCFFFMEWWRNNSLFVENILNISHDEIEKSINYLILNTDFEEGHSIVNKNYTDKKYEIVNDVELHRLAKILVEADLLLNVLPHTGFTKINLILKEAGKSLPDEIKWQYFKSFVEESSALFSSDACVKIKLDVQTKKLSTLLLENMEYTGTDVLMKLISDKIKPI